MKTRSAAAGGTLERLERAAIRKFVKLIVMDDKLLREFILACRASAQRKGAKRKGR
jgi:hypothetical protein